MSFFGKVKIFLFLDLSYRIQQLIIIAAHLILLRWMVYALREAGGLKFTTVMMHFLGMAIFGGILIFSTAWWAKRRYQKELNSDNSEQT